MRRAVWLVSVVSLSALAPLGAQGHGAPGAGDRLPPPLFDDLGNYHREITTSSPSVQAYFDQGLRLMFAFNLEEAQRSFEEAAARDPQCAMCFWGVGLSLSPHYNLPGLPDRTSAAARAVARGLAVAADKPQVERDLLAALAKRVADPAPESPEGFAALDRAYAEAMSALAERYPEDADIQTYYAEALMDLRPWRLWEKDGTPAPGTLEIIDVLEKVLASAPDQPLANHLLIHAVEPSPHPERAIAAAERIARLEPGAAHIVHMPGHIWAQLGRWLDAAAVNRDAIEVDRAYAAKSPEAVNGFYGMYYAHNYQFLWWAALMAGRHAEALENARAVVAGTPLQMLRDFPGFDFLLGYPIWTELTFGRNDAVLAEAAPPEEFVYVTGTWHAARGLAAIRLGRADVARSELAEVESSWQKLDPEAMQAFNSARGMLGIARDWLGGEISVHDGDLEGGLAKLRAAVATEDSIVYDEPPDWYVAVRPSLGRALLEAGRAEEAAAVFRADLEANRESGWSLSGLVASLEIAGGAPDLAQVRQRFVAAWRAADVPPPFGVR